MQLILDPWRARIIGRLPRRFPYSWVEAALIVVLAVQCARMIWLAVAPLGPVGNWKGTPTAWAGASSNALKTFDPFFRLSAQTGATVVTSLPLKLFGVRVDQATGRGSAIIATPDGVQQSFAVGDEVMPGVRLKSVARDNVTIERGGAAEQLFLDQSVPAPVAGPGDGVASSNALGTPGAPAAPAEALDSGIAFSPRMEKGVVTGFAVAPKGAGRVFSAAGFQPGDIVTQINGASFDTVQGAVTALTNIAPGAQVRFSIERAGRAVQLSTTAGE